MKLLKPKLSRNEIEYFHSNNLSIKLIEILLRTNIVKEIENSFYLGKGITTLAFAEENKAICLSIDYYKMLYLMNTNTIPGFKYIRVLELKGEYVFMYEMDLFWDLEEPPENFPLCYEAIGTLSSLFSNKIKQKVIEQEDLEKLEELEVQIDIDLILRLSSEYEEAHIDLHEEQFMFHKDSEKIICIDPIINDRLRE